MSLPAAVADAGSTEPVPPILLVEPGSTAHISVRWTDADGIEHKGETNAPYGSDADRHKLVGNLECILALGGTRLAKGAGHPRGTIVRVGFYKLDKDKPMFDNITKDTVFEVTLSDVRFNQPVDAHADSILQHLKYNKDDMEACGIPGDAREQFNTASEIDTLNDRVRPGLDARLGSLPEDDDADDGDENDMQENILGSSRLVVEDDGSVTMTVRFRYPALRNIRDPWESDLPGTFLEPYHFHLEFEALPEGVDPLDPTRKKPKKLHPAN